MCEWLNCCFGRCFFNLLAPSRKPVGSKLLDKYQTENQRLEERDFCSLTAARIGDGALPCGRQFLTLFPDLKFIGLVGGLAPQH